MIAKFLLTTNQKPDDIKVDLNSSNIDSILAPQDGGTLTGSSQDQNKEFMLLERGIMKNGKRFSKIFLSMIFVIYNLTAHFQLLTEVEG